MIFEISVNNWVGFVFLAGIALIVFGVFLLHRKARKRISEGLRSGGLEFLIQAIHDPTMQEEALEALGKTEDPRAVDALVAFVNTPEIRTEEDAYLLTLGLNALGQTHQPKAVDFLISLLREENEFIRYYACFPLAEALKVVPDFRAVEPLISVLRELTDNKAWRRYDMDFIQAVREALSALAGEDLGSKPERWAQWWERNKSRITFGSEPQP